MNLSYILTYLRDDEELNKGWSSSSFIVILALTICNIIAAALPHSFNNMKLLTVENCTGVALWHVACILFGILVLALMALPTIQTLHCCVISFDNIDGFTKGIDFNCPNFSCDYLDFFFILPFITIAWSTFSVHYQLHNIFRFLYERQQEAESYDRLARRLIQAHQEGNNTGLNFNMDGIILSNETRL